MSELLDHGFELTHYSCPDLSEFWGLRYIHRVDYGDDTEEKAEFSYIVP